MRREERSEDAEHDGDDAVEEGEEEEAENQEGEDMPELLLQHGSAAQNVGVDNGDIDVAVVGEVRAPAVVHAWQRATRAAKRRGYPVPEPGAEAVAKMRRMEDESVRESEDAGREGGGVTVADFVGGTPTYMVLATVYHDVDCLNRADQRFVVQSYALSFPTQHTFASTSRGTGSSRGWWSRTASRCWTAIRRQWTCTPCGTRTGTRRS